MNEGMITHNPRIQTKFTLGLLDVKISPPKCVLVRRANRTDQKWIAFNVIDNNVKESSENILAISLEHDTTAWTYANGQIPRTILKNRFKEGQFYSHANVNRRAT